MAAAKQHKMGGRRGGNSWLIRLGNKLRAVRDMPPIQRGRPFENINMSSISSTLERREEGGSMFGGDIGEAVDADGVNRFVKWCVAAILETGKGLDTDALYQASGGQGEIQRIQEQPECGMQEVLKQEVNVHVLTGALKLFFRSLKHPILRIEEFQDVLEGDEEKLSQVMSNQSNAEGNTLAFFFQHLQEVLQHPDNHMDARALSVVFGPTLMRTRSSDVTSMATEMAAQSRLFELLLDHSDNVFDYTSSCTVERSETPTLVRESLTLNHEDVPLSDEDERVQPQNRPMSTSAFDTVDHEHLSTLNIEETQIKATDDIVILRQSARQPSHVEDSPSDLSDEDDWELQATTIETSAPRHDVARLSTIATSVKLNVPTAL